MLVDYPILFWNRSRERSSSIRELASNTSNPNFDGRARRWKAVIGGLIFSREPFERAIRKNDWYEARVGVPVRGGG